MDLKRRVQHYGWRYDYKARRIDLSMRLGELPPWATRLALRLVRDGLVPQLADQVIVNEYVGRQGISKHVDCPGVKRNRRISVTFRKVIEPLLAENEASIAKASKNPSARKGKRGSKPDVERQNVPPQRRKRGK
jgi:hypothetical protein